MTGSIFGFLSRSVLSEGTGLSQAEAVASQDLPP
jgi:hypothetical protein